MTFVTKVSYALVLLVAAFLATAIPGCAQEKSVSITVLVARTGTVNAKTPGKAADSSNVAVWLTPLDSTTETHAPVSRPAAPKLVQRNKTFEPHLLIVPVGTMVEFPNKDPFFHNIFSLYDGKRFDLGLYEAGTTRSVMFDRPGVSFLFCNIHAAMSAVVVAVDTPYYGLSDRSGTVIIHDVPDGRYQVNVWYERSLPEYLAGLKRTVTITDANRNLGVIKIAENQTVSATHKNKYGMDYVPPPNPEYNRP
jgi:plastocyanin